jgi:hypothetical protein
MQELQTEQYLEQGMAQGRDVQISVEKRAPYGDKLALCESGIIVKIQITGREQASSFCVAPPGSEKVAEPCTCPVFPRWKDAQHLKHLRQNPWWHW